MRIVRAQLEGVDAEPGRIAAADVARVILGLERAIARAAYLALGRARRGATGRHSHAVESAARLRFVGVEHGSFVEVLALPDTAEPSDDVLPISVADLSSMALGRLLEAITEGSAETDVELAAAVAQMASELGIGERNTSITLVCDSVPPGGAPSRATIDAAVRERMRWLGGERPTGREDTLVGVLFEADFEGNKAKLRLPDGGVVVVNFSADLADDIHEALRSRTRLQGLVRYHPRTTQASSVELRSVDRSMQLTLNADAFWRSPTFAELQEEQRTTGHVDPGDLKVSGLSDDERAAFLAALAE